METFLTAFCLVLSIITVGCLFKIGEAIGVCIGDQIKYHYVIWRDKQRNKE